MLEHVKKEFGGDDALEMWRDILKGFETPLPYLMANSIIHDAAGNKIEEGSHTGITQKVVIESGDFSWIGSGDDWRNIESNDSVGDVVYSVSAGDTGNAQIIVDLLAVLSE
jgi:hypothetical protein